MFQSFEDETNPQDGPARLKLLRRAMTDEGLDGFLVPRADAHQGEYVSAHDARLAWLTGFTGSAGFCITLQDRAGVFIDGRYRLQVTGQIAPGHFTAVHWPDVKPASWLIEALPNGGKVGFDPWLHTVAELEEYQKSLSGNGIEMVVIDNLVDRIWHDQPAPPTGKIRAHPPEYSGETSCKKRARLASELKTAGHKAAVITLPDSICWLLNIRGSDVARSPIAQAFAILHDDGKVQLFTDLAKLTDIAPNSEIELLGWGAFEPALGALNSPVRVAKATAPLRISDVLSDAGVEISYEDDPCILPKARKNGVEIAGTKAAHLRDGAAMVEFLCWLDGASPTGNFSEIDVVNKLESFRRATNCLLDISFETICGAGPNGAIVHYRVSEESNRPITPGDLLLIDSGGQYIDGTTDITRTVATGPAGHEEIASFTRVLQGMIAISRARWPKGLSGRDLDPLARSALWMAGQDYDHGTGHGVGSYLGVHEGPQAISRRSEVALEPGMILSNEPGYYREGAFGIRIENLVVVRDAPRLAGADKRDMISMETITFAPIDLRLIDRNILCAAERDWLNSYHAETFEKLAARVSEPARDWLKRATAPI